MTQMKNAMRSQGRHCAAGVGPSHFKLAGCKDTDRVPRMGHSMMLEDEWQTVAVLIGKWLDKHVRH
jgi:hypothetical protein